MKSGSPIASRLLSSERRSPSLQSSSQHQRDLPLLSPQSFSTTTTQARAKEAQRSAQKELQRRLSRFLLLHQQLRRVRDETQREYSVLQHAGESAKALEQALKLRRLHYEEHLINFATLTASPNGTTAMVTTTTLTCCSSSAAPSNSFAAASAEEVKTVQHGAVLNRFTDLLLAAAQAALLLQEQLALHAQKLDHMCALADRAADVEMQCSMGGAFSCDSSTTTTTTNSPQQKSSRRFDDVFVNASPLFPELTIADAEAIIEDAEASCAKASRLSVQMRKLIAMAEAEVERSSVTLDATLKAGLRIAKGRFSQKRRHVDGITFEQNRNSNRLAALRGEQTSIHHRIKRIDESLTLRAVSSVSLSGDAVSAALNREKAALLQRLTELAAKAHETELLLESLAEEKQTAQDEIASVVTHGERCLLAQRHEATRSPNPGGRGKSIT